jgi:hypothetical protein
VLLYSVIVRRLIPSKYDCLANEVEGIGAAAEALVGRDEAIKTSERSNSSVVRGRVVKDKVT